MNRDPFNKPHSKILLSGNDDCNVLYCPTCDALELNLGNVTLRIAPESLHIVSSVLNHAKVHLDKLGYQAARKGIPAQAGANNGIKGRYF